MAKGWNHPPCPAAAKKKPRKENHAESLRHQASRLVHAVRLFKLTETPAAAGQGRAPRAGPPAAVAERDLQVSG